MVTTYTITLFFGRNHMLDPGGVVPADWLKLVEAANLLGMYPGTLYRRWRYGQLPDGTCVKVDNTLYFNRGELEQIRDSQTAARNQRNSAKSHGRV